MREYKQQWGIGEIRRLRERFRKMHDIGDMTWQDVFDEFKKTLALGIENFHDYRPAETDYTQLNENIPQSIMVWMRDGSQIIYTPACFRRGQGSVSAETLKEELMNEGATRTSIDGIEIIACGGGGK